MGLRCGCIVFWGLSCGARRVGVLGEYTGRGVARQSQHLVSVTSVSCKMTETW